MDPLLTRLPDLKQWVVFGFLLCPEELAQPGAVDLLFSVLNTMCEAPHRRIAARLLDDA